MIKSDTKKKLIILTGPTASGKSALAVSLAKRIGGEIISADSMQVYRGMDIGSAKIKQEEMDGIPHHLIDILMPEEEFNVVRFQQLAKEALSGIYERGHIPIVAGGTGFYIQALLYDIDFSQEEEHSEIRKKLEEEAEIYGTEILHERLADVDPASAGAIHPNNRKRVIRALEFWELHGYPISLHNEQQRQRTSPYSFCYFVLTDERARLYSKIEARVDEMLAEGLVSEVSKLKNMGCHSGMVSMQGLGYKEILNFLEGACTLEEAVYQIKRNTRHFAKRQLTWFGRERDVLWINKKDYGYSDAKILEYMEACIQKL
ncbi:MAG: tRNA (adenosine(37)-N6)-dimethylallyltransferase MiaA [Lachnospiraceae bacterium]|nr:tRNA (adenosine(37)-N6)-dimethylallyltransferase MiaA [Lachnospiraceae bacterium]